MEGQWPGSELLILRQGDQVGPVDAGFCFEDVEDVLQALVEQVPWILRYAAVPEAWLVTRDP